MDTFVVRVWEPADPGATRKVRGTVRCVRTGVEIAFRDEAELLSFITANRRLDTTQGESHEEAPTVH